MQCNTDFIRLSLFLFLFLGHECLNAQTVHTVEDPEITFSMEIPKDWRVEDDGYTFAIVPPSGGREYMEFTYYETSETDLEKAFDFTVLAFNGPDELDAKILVRGDDMINDAPAKWAKMSFEVDDTLYYRLVYLIIKDGQYYIFRGNALPDNFDFYRPIFERTIHSLETRLTDG
jgi:hypothetical protein